MTTSALPNRPSRRPLFAVARPLLVALALCVGGFATAQERPASGSASPDASREALIRELIELTDAEQLEGVFSRQFIDRVANAVALVQPQLDPRTMRVIREESAAVVRDRIESGDALYSVLYPVYSKHFNIVELSRLVEFYQSPLGQKLVRVSPQLLTESLSLGREWGLSLVPEIIDRVQSRLGETGSD